MIDGKSGLWSYEREQSARLNPLRTSAAALAKVYAAHWRQRLVASVPFAGRLANCARPSRSLDEGRPFTPLPAFRSRWALQGIILVVIVSCALYRHIQRLENL